MAGPIRSGLLRKLRTSLGYLALVATISVAGYCLVFRWPLMDAIYMVAITIFGVGFGEVQPVQTVAARTFTIFVIIAGTSAIAYVIGELVRFVTEGEIMKAIGEHKKSRQVESLANHAIICGYGRIGQILAHELSSERFPFVVVDLDDERLTMAEESGYLFVKGSATEEETLQRAHIERATVLATVLPQDTLNVFITLTARNLNRHLRIIARGEQPTTEKKLRQAGADEVVLPAAIGGTRIAHSITRPATMQFLGDKRGMVSQDLKQLGVEIDELRLVRHTHLVGRTVAELQTLSDGNILVIALKRADGSLLRSGFLEEKLHEGDAVIIIGRTQSLSPALVGEVNREELL